MKYIIFSDHHRGRRDGADDFLPCEVAYLKALNYYLDEGYNLLLLGDVEEFWENPFARVLKSYKQVLDKEKQFYKEKRLDKIWGNHDDNWQFPLFISKKLGRWFPGMIAHEGLCFELTKEGKFKSNILFIHGHQGTRSSDKFAGISKFFVRYFWRNIQRLFKVPLSTPATDMGLKSKHDQAMYSWAAAKPNQIIICGHTHQPVFLSRTHLDDLLEKKEQIESKDALSSADKEALQQINDKIVEIGNGTLLNKDKSEVKPCYFNSGCCSFKDGDITGLELTNEGISLVKWNREERVVHRKEPWERIF